jgi:cell division transport system permease protein
VSAVRYAFDEAIASLWRRRRANVLSVVTISVALFVLGVFLLLNVNVQRWIGRWNEAAEFSVYLDAAITREQRASIERALDHQGGVVSREYVSSEQALDRFAQMFPDLASSARTVGDRPLPASYNVRLAPGATDAGTIDALSSELERLPGVIDVRYDRQWIERIAGLVRAGRLAGGALVIVLVLAAALTVASVVRLAMYARLDEIEIMQLVGAPLAYIRGPFVCEGVLQGGIGSVVALVLLYLTYALARIRVSALAPAGALPADAFGFLPPLWALALIVGGMAVGCLGGVIAARGAR